MKHSVNIKNLLICMIFYFSMLGVLFLYWLIGKALVTYFVVGGSLLLIIVDLKNTKIDKVAILLLFLLILYITLNLAFTNSTKNYLFDAIIKGTFFPIFVGYYIIKLRNYEFLEKNILTPSMYILSIYCIINFFLMLKQVSTPWFMVHNRTANTYYVDMITGFIGENGTHKLTFLFIASLYINYYFFNDENKIKRNLSKFFFIFILLSSLYISTFNDNRMYYFLAFAFLLPIIYKKIVEKVDIKKLGRKVMLLFIGIVAILVFYKVNSDFHQFVQEEIVVKYIDRTFNKISASTNNSTESREERMELFKYAVANSNFIIGSGIGSIHLSNDSSVPRHFGINDIIVRMYTGGIIFVLMILIIYSRIYNKLFQNKSLINSLYIMFLVFFISFYTQSFSQIEKTFIISVAFLTMSVVHEKISVAQKKGIVKL